MNEEAPPALEPFEALVGAWSTEATHPQFDGAVAGDVTFEWLEGGRFVVQRSRNEHESFPDAIGVIGAPEAGDGLVMEYFDSRGVRRTYRISLEDGQLRIWREHPQFAQRFSATLAHDAFDGRWQVARAPGEWRDDLSVTYRRRPAESPVFRHAGISYLRVGSNDPKRAAAFYEAVFGWRFDTRRADPSFEDGSGHVIGHFVSGEADVRPYVYVDRIDDALERIAANGGALVEAPYPEGDLWVATFRDPAGNVVGVWQRGPRLAPVGDS